MFFPLKFIFNDWVILCFLKRTLYAKIVHYILIEEMYKLKLCYCQISAMVFLRHDMTFWKLEWNNSWQCEGLFCCVVCFFHLVISTVHLCCGEVHKKLLIWSSLLIPEYWFVPVQSNLLILLYHILGSFPSLINNFLCVIFRNERLYFFKIWNNFNTLNLWLIILLKKLKPCF